MNNFKNEQEVICIDDSKTVGADLIKGKIYKVDLQKGTEVYLKGIKGAYASYRFIPLVK